MKIKLTGSCTIIFLLLFMVETYAASSFNVQDYIPKKFTDLRWIVDGDFNLSGNKQDRYDGNYYNNRSYNYKSDYVNYTINMGSSLLYRHEEIQTYYKMGLSGYMRFRSNKSHNTNKSYEVGAVDYDERFSESSTKSIQFRISPSFSYGKYFKHNIFGEINSKLRVDVQKTLKDDDFDRTISYDIQNNQYLYRYETDASHADSYDRRYLATIEFIGGVGRLYHGWASVRAINMISDLRKKGLIKNEPSEKFMVRLADLIYQNSQTHVIDSRITRMEDISSIYNLLVENQIIELASAYGILIIEDVYSYYPNDLRSFGLKFKGGAGLELMYRSDQSTIDSDVRRLYYDYPVGNQYLVDTTINETSKRNYFTKFTDERLWKYLSGTLEYEKPLNAKWQIGLLMDGRYYIDSYEIDGNYNSHMIDNIYNYSGNSIYTEIKRNYDFRADYTIDFFYSSRTILRADIYYYYKRFHSVPQEGTGQNYANWSYQFRYSIDYRLNIPTTIRLGLNYYSTYRDYALQYSDEDRFSLSLSLSHYIY